MSWSHYTKVKKIGEGSFGKAWLVKNNKDLKQYVIKEISISRMQFREKEEARKEVAVLAQMKHPNIVSYVDSFEELGNLFIIMDYCDGGDLHGRIKAQRGVHLSEDQVLDWFVQITLALKHVHDRKILHRDLKSQNIFLTRDNAIKLGDFGVAKVLANTMEMARTSIGTPYYMSPEICESKPYNNKSDVWSLGCVLYELANLKHPFDGFDMKNLIMKILRGVYEPLKTQYSYDLRNLVASMLKRDPKERPSVNGILRKAFIIKRCSKFLSDEKLAEEFSHTILHGEQLAKKLQKKTPQLSRPASRVSNTPSKPSLAAYSPVPKYDLANIYNQPLASKRPISSAAVKKSLEKKDLPGVVKRLASNEEQPQKKLLDSLAEKQKQDRLRRARDSGVLSVLGNSSVVTPRNDQYAHYHRQLDAFKQKQIDNAKNLNNFEIIKQQNVLNNKVPSSQAPIVDEYLQRRADAARNKNRDQSRPPLPLKNIQKEYVETLNKIRMQNLNRKIDPKQQKIQREAQLKKLHAEQQKALEREKKQWEEHLVKKGFNRPVVNRAKPICRVPAATPIVSKIITPPSPINLTEVLGAIGVAGKKIENKQTKEEILKNLNEKDQKLVINGKKLGWQKQTNLSELDQKPLANSDLIASHEEARKVWDTPHRTVIKALEEAQLHETVFVSSSNSLPKIISTTVTIEKSNAPRTPPQIDTNESTLNLIEDERLPSCVELDQAKETNNESLALEMTFGHFDMKNVTLLRTCSEPNLNQLFTIREEQETQKSTKKVKSLELLEIQVSTAADARSTSSDNDSDDMSEVCLSLEQHLMTTNNNSDSDDDSPAKTIRRNKRSKKQVSIDSVRLSLLSKLNDLNEESLSEFNGNETASVTITLDDSGSCDTEFEDELYAVNNRFERMEEKRAHLEKELGAESFIRVYKSIKDLIDSDDKFDNIRSSTEALQTMLPNEKQHLYEEVLQCVLADEAYTN